MSDGSCSVEFEGGGLRDLRSELGTEFGHIVGEECCLMAGAGDGDVAKAGVEQVRVNVGIGVDEDALGGEALGAVAGYSIAMIEMAVLSRIELYLAVIVQARREAAIGMDRLDDGKVTIGNPK